MSRHLTAAAAVLLTFCSLPGAAAADVLYMENGDRISGTIKRVWDGELFIESDYADEFAVSLDAVARIESDGEFEIELRDHSETTGRFATDETGAMVLVTEAGAMPFSPAAIEELNEPEQYFDWESRSDFDNERPFRSRCGNCQTIQLRGTVGSGSFTKHLTQMRWPCDSDSKA